MSSVLHHGSLESYSPVVAVRRHGGRVTPIRRTRYIVRCSCGWVTVGGDYIDSRRSWGAHVGT